MKDLSNLQAVTEQIAAEYHPDAERLNKAIEMVKVGGLRKLSNGNIQVPSGTKVGQLWQVSLERRECNCWNFVKQHATNPNHLCKHILATLIWQALPDVKVIPVEIQDLYSKLGLKVAA